MVLGTEVTLGGRDTVKRWGESEELFNKYNEIVVIINCMHRGGVKIEG